MSPKQHVQELDSKPELDAQEYIDTPDEELKGGKAKVNNQLDQAAQILADAGHVEFSKEEKKRVLKWIDFYVCLPMCIVYWIQQMDKATVTYGALFDLQTALKLHGQQYALLSSIVYIAQLICQPLSAYALVVFPVKYWVLANYFVWTVCTMCCAACTSWKSLMVCRFFLGAAEATILPSFVMITQMWWTRREQSYRTVTYQIANSMAAITGPLIAWGIGHVTKGIYAYQGIFLVVGAVGAFFIPIVAWLLPNSPVTARFLRKGDDRLIALDRIRENNTGTKSNVWKWHQVREVLKDPKTYIWALIYLTSTLAASGFGKFGGLIIKGLGFTSFSATLMGMPTGAEAMVTLAIAIWVTNRIKMRWPVIAFICFFPIAGAVGIRVLDRSNLPGMVASYYVTFVYAAIQPLFYAWANLNQAGSTKRVVMFAIMFGAQCLGNIIGPLVWLDKEAPKYYTGLAFAIAMYCALFCLVVGQGFYLKYLNKKQRERRIAMGLPAELQDISIMTLNEATAYKAELMEALRASGGNMDIFSESFDDLTDWENPMFMYVV
ncbi:uncharacterized protein EHS24_000097 [Apiotrichum porosum]|uniref:Major facilitator superfamily (MFS) profile domain-containing protein n=1 Tax=Apiotrichum porosum TaxID=105984 RepID=A0A427Y904_9TREE|nr:uncharacterized protein EHS24_000097 [Apiotrichum porosum]RSH87586.1 hypothetical protein EHS24_000097 [Apiotrichum porosum]